MQVTETLSEGLKRAFTIVLPAQDIEARRSQRLDALGKTLRLPGFRPGKVPLSVIRQRFGTAVSAEVLEESLGEATQRVLTDRGLRPALQPKVELATENATSIATVQDIEFKVEMELLPEIELPDFSTVELVRMKAEVDPATIDELFGSLAKSRRTLADLTDDDYAARGGAKGAAKGDVLVVDFEGKIDGVPFDGGKMEGAEVEIGGGDFIPGFAEQLDGLEAGGSRTISVTFPADYRAENLAGKAATFDVVAKRLCKSEAPTVDDAFAESLGYDSLEEMRKDFAGRRQRDHDQLARTRIKRQLLDALSERVSFPIPEAMREREFDEIWRRLQAEKEAGRLDEDDKDKDDDTLRAEYGAIAERRVRLGLLLAEIGRVNNLSVTDDELGRAMRQEAARYPGQEQAMMDMFRKYPALADGLRGPIFEEKVVDFVLELAKVEEKAVTLDELTAEPPAPKY